MAVTYYTLNEPDTQRSLASATVAQTPEGQWSLSFALWGASECDAVVVEAGQVEAAAHRMFLDLVQSDPASYPLRASLYEVQGHDRPGPGRALVKWSRLNLEATYV